MTFKKFLMGATLASVISQSAFAQLSNGSSQSSANPGTSYFQTQGVLTTTSPYMASKSSVGRTPSARASDLINVKDFGAKGDGSATAIGTAYGANLAAFASYTAANGNTPFSWATNPLFGLTFTMFNSAPGAAGATSLTFLENLQGGFNGAPLPWIASNVPEWEDPANAYMLLQTGMLVSGCGLNGATVTAIPSNTVRQGELIPGSTDFSNTAKYSAGNMVAANGNFYTATVAIAAGGGAPSGNGGSGWTLAAQGEGFALPTGAVGFSSAITACPVGSPITFTISPAQLQALTQDYVGIQSAMATAWAQPRGGRVYSPAGIYTTNHPLMNAGGMTDTNVQNNNVEIYGDGFALTQIVQTTDFGPDKCAMGESTRTNLMSPVNFLYAPNTQVSPGAITFINGVFYIASVGGTTGANSSPSGFSSYNGQPGSGMTDGSVVWSWYRGSAVSSYSSYADFRLVGPSTGVHANGVSPAQMDGLCYGADARLFRVQMSGYRAGELLNNDHQETHGVVSTNNGYGVLYANYSTTMGNQMMEDGGLDGNKIASVGFESSGQMDDSLLKNLATGFGVYGFYALPTLPTVTTPQGAAVTKSELFTAIEGVAEGWLYGTGPNAQFSNNEFHDIGGDGDAIGVTNYARNNGAGGLVPAQSLIYVDVLNGNTFFNSKMSGYNLINGAMITTLGDCSNNGFIDDLNFLYGNLSGVVPSAAHPPIHCGGLANSENRNWFKNAYNEGVFELSGFGQTQNQGAVVRFQPGGGDYAVSWNPGTPVLGVVQTGCGPDNASECAIVTRGLALNVSFLGAAPSVGSSVFPDNYGNAIGIVAGLDNTLAIGTTANGPSNGGTVNVLVDPLAGQGAHGFVAMAATSTNPTIPATHVDVTSGTGGVSLVPNVPTGAEVVICNDTTAVINVAPQSGATVTGTATVGIGACSAVRHINTNLWHM